MLETPVVLLTFNRPDHTRRVLEVLAQVQPRVLRVVSDGPRHSGDEEPVRKTRALFDDLPWPCEVERDFAGENLACALRVASGLDAVFEEHEEAIVLEDDTVPHPSFFSYAEELLERYRQDPQVMQISGTLMNDRPLERDSSYVFTQIVTTWGWATWRRAWQHFDTSYFRTPFYRFLEKNRRVGDGVRKLMAVPNKIHRVVTGGTGIPEADRDPDLRRRIEDCGRFQMHGMRVGRGGRGWGWGFVWCWTVLRENGLVATPRVNLVSNIGFGAGATHAPDESNPFANRTAQEMPFPLHHPAAPDHDRAATIECGRAIDRAFGLTPLRGEAPS